MNGLSFAKEALGEEIAKPFHPVTIAFLIAKKFASFEAASEPNGFGYPAAMMDCDIPGGAEIMAALDLLQNLLDGRDLTSTVAAVSQQWKCEVAFCDPASVLNSQNQAARLVPRLESLIPVWSPLIAA